MSVFVSGREEDFAPPRSRKKYETKYSIKYELEYEWVGPSGKGDTYALCRWCGVDICIKSVGAKGLRDHEITGRHKQRASHCTPPPLNNAVYPVLEVEGGVEQPVGETVHSYPRPATPQTPNTPLSPQGEDLPQPPTILHFSSQINAATDQHTDSHSQSKESLIIEYDDPNNCTSTAPASASVSGCVIPVSPTSASTSGSVIPTSSSASKPTPNIKREAEDKFNLCTDDLTCNLCGQEFVQWTHLKKHLLDHVLIAQNSAENKARISGRGGRSKSVAKGSTRPSHSTPKLKQAKQEPHTESSTAAVATAVPAKRRGRPRGRYMGRTSKPLPNLTPLTLTPPVRRAGQGGTELEEDVDDPDSVEEENDACQDAVDPLQPRDSEGEGVSGEEEGGSEDKGPRAGKKKPGPLQCRVCRIIFFNRRELREHQQTEHNNGRPYQCCQCHKFFTTKNHLEVHTRHKHSLGPNPCQCSVCGKVLSSRTNLRIHMRIHKGERPFECPVCHKAFSRKANMEMHVVYHTGERCFTCEICGQTFYTINALKRHTKLHTGERDYACEVCGATYVTGTDLRRHRLKHEQVKPFPCHLCDKQFTRSHDLKVHVRYHNKELRFTCDVCNKQFVESGNYKRHMRRHTGERPYTCYVCLLTFSQVHHLKTHMRTSHYEEVAEGAGRGGGVGEDRGEGDGRGAARVPPHHRNPRLTARRTPKSTLHHHPSPATLPHNQPSQPHLAPHPHPGGGAGQPVTPPMTQPTPAGTTSQVPSTATTNHAVSGFLHTYNSHIYNHSTVPPYPALFEMCPQNSVNHSVMH